MDGRNDMKIRTKKFVVYVMVVLLVFQLFGMDKMILLAAELSFSTDVTISEDDDKDYIYSSGGEKTLTVASGVTVSGKIDFTRAIVDTYENKLVNNGTVLGDIITGNALTYIENNGTISSSSFNLTSNSRLRNLGTIRSVNLEGGELELNGGSIDSVMDSDHSMITLSSGRIGTLSTASMIYVNNTVEINSLTVGSISPSENAKLFVADYVKVSDEIGDAQLVVEKDTVIDTTGGSGYSVYYNDKEYTIEDDKKGSLLDFYGKRIVVSVPLDGQVSLSGGSDTALYMPGETSSVYKIKALDGYYFPEGFENTITTSGVGTLQATRVNDQEMTILYTLSVNESGDIQISVPSAAKKPKEQGSGSLIVEDIYYGATIVAIANSQTNDVSNAKIEYKKKGAEDSSYSIRKPKKVGAYTARATFMENDNYKGFEVTTDFSISFLPIPNHSYVLSGEKGDNGFYISDVTITPLEGYSVSDTLDGKYKSTLVVKSSVKNAKLYLMNDETGEKTSGKKVTSIKIDKTLPVIGAEDKKIYYEDKVTVKVSDKNLSEVRLNGNKSVIQDNQALLTLNANNGSSVYKIEAVDLAGNSRIVDITIAAKWLETGVIPVGENVRLNVNQAYRLESGKWSVKGDTTKYSGGQQFYVRTEGEYTFIKE